MTEIERLREWQRRAAGLIEDRQWSRDELSWVFVCYACGASQEEGHAPDCALAVLLREAED